MNQTISYYNQNADAFIQETRYVDMQALYQTFLPHIPESGALLDAGCGSCRDALYFYQQGYQVSAFDASQKMVEQAPIELAGKVEQSTFEEYSSTCQFDGIWACASLLHVPLQQLPKVLKRLSSMLAPNGTFYLSFKYGTGERQHNGRSFTDLNEQGLTTLLEQLPELTIYQSWKTADVRPGRSSEEWLNALLKKGC